MHCFIVQKGKLKCVINYRDEKCPPLCIIDIIDTVRLLSEVIQMSDGKTNMRMKKIIFRYCLVVIWVNFLHLNLLVIKMREIKRFLEIYILKKVLRDLYTKQNNSVGSIYQLFYNK